MPEFKTVPFAKQKLSQLMENAQKQLSPEEYAEFKGLMGQLMYSGLTAELNVALGTFMHKISIGFEISESPEWPEALAKCDEAFLGTELKQMCIELGMSYAGHKKELCRRLYKRGYPAIVAVMEPYIKAGEVLGPKPREWPEEKVEETAEQAVSTERQPVNVILRLEREPLTKTGIKYAAYLEDGTPLYMADESLEHLKYRVSEFIPVKEFIVESGIEMPSEVIPVHYGPLGDAPIAMKALWNRALVSVKQTYPLGEPILTAEAQKQGVTPREMQLIIADERYRRAGGR